MGGKRKCKSQGHWSAELVTRAGVALTIRPVEPTDRSLMEDFFRHVGADDLRFRFLTPLRQVDDARLADMCVVDVPRAMTFLAFDGAMLAAIATVVGEPATCKAEVALTTRPEWKRQGVSWTLLDHAVRFARANGFEEIVSIERADTAEALGVERDMGFHQRLIADGGGELIASKALNRA